MDPLTLVVLTAITAPTAIGGAYLLRSLWRFAPSRHEFVGLRRASCRDWHHFLTVAGLDTEEGTFLWWGQLGAHRLTVRRIPAQRGFTSMFEVRLPYLDLRDSGRLSTPEIPGFTELVEGQLRWMGSGTRVPPEEVLSTLLVLADTLTEAAPPRSRKTAPERLPRLASAGLGTAEKVQLGLQRLQQPPMLAQGLAGRLSLPEGGGGELSRTEVTTGQLSEPGS